MSRALPRIALLCVATFCTSSCALVATKGDYADYREVRLATEPRDRQLATRRYLERHPHGQWHEPLAAAQKSEELEVFESGKDSRSGLEHYLQVYPDGTFVGQARSRLQAVALIEQQRAQASKQAEQLAQARQARAEELRRTWVGRFLAYWVKTLAELHGWGDPIADVARQNQQFSRAFGALPRPRCTPDECVKYYVSEYALPVPGGNRLERTLSLLLRLRLRAGKLERAELLLPERGFTRWFEFENRQAIDAGDPASRAKAVDWAFEQARAGVQALGEGYVAEAASTLPKIDAPAIGPSGERIDTSIESPTDPQNRLSAEDNAGIGVQAVKPQGQGIGELVKPKAAQPAPDMTFEALGVGRSGQRVEVPQSQPAAPSGEAAPEMTFAAPLEVPKAANAQPDAHPAAAAAAPKPEPGPPPEAAVAPRAQSFQKDGLHIVLFAAGSTGPAYDGLVIERVATKPKRPAAAPKPAAAATPAAAAPKPAATTTPAAATTPAAPAPNGNPAPNSH